MATNITHYCDVCKKEIVSSTKSKDRLGLKLQVIFTTEQTEGRSCPHHLSEEKLDICGDCIAHIVKGNYLWGHGAQGYNTYYFKSEVKTNGSE